MHKEDGKKLVLKFQITITSYQTVFRTKNPYLDVFAK